jgi:hypothetical protein
LAVDLLRTQQAEGALRQAQEGRGQQTLLTIVCAWCQQTMRWQRAEGAAQGQISHSICFDCFADLLQELARLCTKTPSFPQSFVQEWMLHKKSA